MLPVRSTACGHSRFPPPTPPRRHPPARLPHRLRTTPNHRHQIPPGSPQNGGVVAVVPGRFLLFPTPAATLPLGCDWADDGPDGKRRFGPDFCAALLVDMGAAVVVGLDGARCPSRRRARCTASVQTLARTQFIRLPPSPPTGRGRAKPPAPSAPRQLRGVSHASRSALAQQPRPATAAFWARRLRLARGWTASAGTATKFSTGPLQLVDAVEPRPARAACPRELGPITARAYIPS